MVPKGSPTCFAVPEPRTPISGVRNWGSRYWGLTSGLDPGIVLVMQIDIADQRSGSHPTLIEIDHDLVEAYCGMAGVDLSVPGTLKIRIRDGHGPYGFTSPCSGGYRVVINVRYQKVHLSEGARYVVSNTLLHEIRHVAQMQGHKALHHDYNGWSETEAREFGRMIKDQSELFAVR